MERPKTADASPNELVVGASRVDYLPMPAKIPVVRLAALLVVAGTLTAAQTNRSPAVNDDGISVYFSPAGGCTEAIVQKIASARKSVDVQAYSFTSTTIARALEAAQKRGVKVRAILDSSNETDRFAMATFLTQAGITTLIDGEHQIAHNKVMILDGQTLITGSFNFTKAAEEKNAENLLVIENQPKLVEAYNRNFAAHLAHSHPYRR